METWLDLHMHSKYSLDGELPPAELMRRCRDAGLRVAALADHNAVQGLAEAEAEARSLGLGFFPAIEIDCIHQGRNFHLLGYGIRAAAFEAFEKEVHEKERAAARKLIGRVRELGFFFDEEKVWEKAENGIIVAEMIAEVVLQDARNDGQPLLQPLRPGGVHSANPLVSFFWDFCSRGKPAFVEIPYISLAEAADAIKENGGAAVLAHPGANIGKNETVTESVIDTGIDGIEAYSNYHDADTCSFYDRICRRHGLLATAGSDFHGKMKPSIHLGKLSHPAPQAVYERLVQLIAARKGAIVLPDESSHI